MTDNTLNGVNVLIEGAAGTGKTHSIGTLVDQGINVRYFAFENGTESLIGYWRDRGLPVPANLAIFTVKAAAASWTEMADATKNVNQLSYDALKKTSDANRSKYDQFEKFLRTFAAPVDDKGTKFPPVDAWTNADALVIDGLTGMGVAAMSAVIGGKFDKDQKDWGLAQNMVENTLRRLCDACKCHVIVISHVEREPDPLGGVSKITVSTLGAKLAPKIPPMFSDVIMAKRIGKEFFWDTEDALADLKTRNLPIQPKLRPDFAQIIKTWRNRGAQA